MKIEANVRVLFCDTDCGGVVSNVAYLRFVEAARMDLISALGMTVAEMTKTSVFPAVVKTEIDYRRPARLGDEIQVTAVLVSVEKVRATVSFELMAKREGADPIIVAEAVQTVAMVDTSSGRPRRIPENWARKVL